jgi:hypothetical protein
MFLKNGRQAGQASFRVKRPAPLDYCQIENLALRCCSPNANSKTAVLRGGLFCYQLKTFAARESGRRVKPSVNVTFAAAAASR